MSGMFEGYLEGLLGALFLRIAVIIFAGYLVFMLICLLRFLWKNRRKK